jgi:hypothetical protein
MALIKAKNNQAKSYFSYKNDDIDLVEVGQFIRDTTDFRVEREWYITFDKLSGKYMMYSETFNGNPTVHPRNPDLILIDKKTKKLKLVIEIDGAVHDKGFLTTQERNEEYFFAGVPLLVISKLEIETNIFDLVHKKLGEKLGIKD